MMIRVGSLSGSLLLWDTKYMELTIYDTHVLQGIFLCSPRIPGDIPRNTLLLSDNSLLQLYRYGNTVHLHSSTNIYFSEIFSRSSPNVHFYNEKYERIKLASGDLILQQRYMNMKNLGEVLSM